MSTHADVIRAARDAVVEAAKAVVQTPHATWGAGLGHHDDCAGCAADLALPAVVDALIAAEQAACGECKAVGGEWIVPACVVGRLADFVPCPACHGTGRKPDTFRDDGATTPEGCEDEVPGA